jgi:CBS domain-containing protein
MNVDQMMTTNLRTCSPQHMLDCAARIMWENDCGVVPIVDAGDRVVGMITDRDICIAAYTQNQLLNQIPVSSIAMKPVVTVRPEDTAQTAESSMQRHQIRRLAVVDGNGRLVGMLSLNDLARSAGRNNRDLPPDEVVRTLAAICQPRAANRSNATA